MVMRLLWVIVLFAALLNHSNEQAMADSSGIVNQPGSPLLCGYEPYLTALPVSPPVTNTVNLTVGGVWPSSCRPTQLSYASDDNQIRINAAHEYPPAVVCAFVLTPWELSVTLTNLPAGEYQSELYLVDLAENPTLCVSSSFNVPPLRDSFRSIYLPLIAGIDTATQ